VPSPDTQTPSWVEDCDWPMPWLAELAVANTFMVIEVGPKSSTNDIASTAELTKILFRVIILFIQSILLIKVYKLFLYNY
jgi:hypothetical protein